MDALPVPKTRSSRFETLDQWRGLAALMVVAFHSMYYVGEGALGASLGDTILWFVAKCWVAVPMFFVISGYGISATADSCRRGKYKVSQYFVRRLRRVFPPFWIAMGVLALSIYTVQYHLWPGLLTDDPYPVPDPSQMHAWQWAGNLTLTENWRIHFSEPDRSWLIMQAWTLGYEEQFYAVVGLLLIFCRRRLFIAAGVLTLLQIVIRALPKSFHVNDYLSGFFIDGRWEMFAAGMAIYCIVTYFRRWQVIAAWIVIPLLAAAHLKRNGLFDRDIAAAWGFGLLLLVLRRWDVQIASSRWVWPFDFSGRFCYSLYLIHWPLVKGISHALYAAGLTSRTETALITVPICLAASLGFGWLFYMAVERHFLNAPNVRVVKPASQPATGSPLADRSATLHKSPEVILEGAALLEGSRD